MLGRFFRRGKVRPGFFFPRKNIYTGILFPGVILSRDGFSGGEVLCGGKLYATTPASACACTKTLTWPLTHELL